MANAIIQLPIPYIGDFSKGRPLFNASIYVGVPDLDPEIPSNQLQIVGIQEDGTEVNLPQPVLTGSGGYPTYNGSPIRLAVDGAYSLKVLDKLGNQEYYFANVLSGAPITSENGIISYASLTEAVSDASFSVGNQVYTASYRSQAECATLGIDYPDGGGADYVVEELGAPDGSGDHSAGNKQLTLNAKILFVEQFGVNTGLFSQTEAMQAAWNYSAAKKRVLKSSVGGIFSLAKSGLIVEGKDYALLAIDGINVQFDDTVTLRIMDNQNADIITTDRLNGQLSSVRLKGFTVDGNNLNNTGSGWRSIWLKNIKKVYFNNIYSINASSWGARLELCDSVILGDYSCDHDDDVNADGLHFVDCNNVVGTNINIYTEGDDGLIIESLTRDVHSYNLTGVVVRTPENTNSAANRGLLIFREDTLAAAPHLISNITVSATMYDCKGAACAVGKGSYEGLNLDINAEGCEYGYILSAGDVNHAGYLRGSKFKGVINKARLLGLSMNDVNGPMSGLDFDLNIFNPDGTIAGAVVRGDNHTGKIIVDYDPFSTGKVGSGIVWYANDCVVNVSSFGGTNSMITKVGAVNNVFTVGKIVGGTVASLKSDSGTSNRWIGGEVGTPSDVSRFRDSFFGTVGADVKNEEELSPDASGLVVLPHGLIAQPMVAFANTRSSAGVTARVLAIDDTNLTFRFEDPNGSPVTGGAYRVNWQATI